MDNRIEVSESFCSIQGEGPNAGVPSVFLRTRRCPLRCSWCDTKFTWSRDDPGFWEYQIILPEQLAKRLESAARLGVGSYLRTEYEAEYGRVEDWTPTNLVITGGEPLIWKRQLQALLAQPSIMRTFDTVEVETSGTIPWALNELLEERYDVRYNVSPKLVSAGNEHTRASPLHIDRLRFWAANPRANFKLVVDSEVDDYAARTLVMSLDVLGVGNSRISLMPEGSTPERLAITTPPVVRMAKDLGVGLSPRRHIIVWGERRGV